MAALGFKQRFVAPIRRRSNPKDQTIRSFRKYPIKQKERLYLFTGMRTPNCKKIGEAVCLNVWTIELSLTSYRFILDELDNGMEVIYEMKKIDGLDEFAQRDGFRSWGELIDYWKKEHGDDCFPFRGELIRFRLLPKKHWNRQVPEEKIA